jgi:hypothetical protein
MRKLLLASLSMLALSAGAALADNSVSNVVQTGTSSSTGPVATVTQSGAYGSTSNITQTDSGASRVDVIQSDNGAGGVATGAANLSNVVTDNASGGATVSVTQTHNQSGAQNRSDVQQGRNGFDHHIGIEQIGAGNTSVATEFTSSSSLINVRQDGLDNQSSVRQDFQNNGQAWVGQTGNANTVQIQQIATGFAPPPPDSFGASNFAQATQNGNNNQSYITQSNDFDNSPTPVSSDFARTSQIGDDNLSFITQTGVDGAADVYQTGSHLVSTIAQSGVGDDATVVQQGTDQYSSIVQSGNNDSADVRQYHSSNESYINQSGNGAQASVTQASYNNYSNINQTTGGLVVVNQ